MIKLLRRLWHWHTHEFHFQGISMVGGMHREDRCKCGLARHAFGYTSWPELMLMADVWHKDDLPMVAETHLRYKYFRWSAWSVNQREVAA